MPLLAAGLQPVASPRSLWARLLVVLEKRLAPPRALAALKAFRDLLVSLAAEVARRATSRRRSASCSSARATCSDLREDESEEAEARIENLMELVSAAREYETREPDAALGGFVDRLSLLSEADEAEGAKEARVWLMRMHAAKGLEFPIVDRRGHGGRAVPALPIGGGRGRGRGGAAAVLRLPDAGARAADSDERRPAADLRRLPGHRTVAVSRRDPRGAHAARRARRRHRDGTHRNTSCGIPTAGVRRPRPASATPRRPASSTNTKTSQRPAMRAGMRVRHRSSASGPSSPSKIMATTTRSR